MGELGKILLMTGGALVLLGSIFIFSEKIPGFGRLPGDIFIKKENFSFYFPLATCLLISLILTFIFQLWSRK